MNAMICTDVNRSVNESVFRTFYRSVMRSGVALALVAGLSACGSDTVEPVHADVETLFWRLEVNRPAITISTQAPYDTVRLTAIPVNIYGRPIASTALPIFEKASPSAQQYTLSPDGLITAKAAVTSAIVRVTMTIDGVTKGVAAQIKIINTLPVRRFSRIVVRPVPDSGVYWSFGEPIRLLTQAVYATYTGTDSMVASGQWLRWGTSRVPDLFKDPGIITANQATLTASDRIGESWIVVRAFAYGDDFVDSVLLRKVEVPVKYVQTVRLTPSNGPLTLAFQPSEITINAGNTVVFGNPWRKDAPLVPMDTIVVGSYTFFSRKTGDSIDVVFDDSLKVLPGNHYPLFNAAVWGATTLPVSAQPWTTATAPTGESGNIPAFSGVQWVGVWRVSPTFVTSWEQDGSSSFRMRKFSTPGTYRYHSTRYPNATGVIHVR